MAKTVLIVDDDENIRTTLRYAMEGEGYQVLIAGDGEEALSIVEGTRPDLILLDVTMPKRDGYDVCQTLRGDTLRGYSGTSMVKIIMLSVKGRGIDVEKGLAIGADAYMTKPFSTRELKARVRDMLDGDSHSHG